MTTSTPSIVSIGQACALIQQMPDRIRGAAEELGIKPAMRVNLVDHFAEDDLQRIANHLQNRKDAR